MISCNYVETESTFINFGDTFPPRKVYPHNAKKKVSKLYLTGTMHTWTWSTLVHFNFTVSAVVSLQTLTVIAINLILMIIIVWLDYTCICPIANLHYYSSHDSALHSDKDLRHIHLFRSHTGHHGILEHTDIHIHQPGPEFIVTMPCKIRRLHDCLLCKCHHSSKDLGCNHRGLFHSSFQCSLLHICSYSCSPYPEKVHMVSPDVSWKH